MQFVKVLEPGEVIIGFEKLPGRGEMSKLFDILELEIERMHI